LVRGDRIDRLVLAALDAPAWHRKSLPFHPRSAGTPSYDRPWRRSGQRIQRAST
jgi:hypothetical protein